jgi:hypothetical protein
MALNHNTVTLGTTAKILVKVPSGAGKVNVYISNNDASNDFFIGASTVTSSGATQGFRVPKSTNVQLQVDGGDTIYAISAAGTPTGSVLWFGN